MARRPAPGDRIHGPDGFHQLRAIARRVVDMALAGNMAAIREIGDRIDGKPTQSIEAEGGLVVVLSKDDELFE